MGALAERILRKANRCVSDLDANLVDEVLADDLEIDQIEVRLDEAILRALALHAPVAEELRLVIAVKAMATDLERVGDLSRNIAKSAGRLAARTPTELRLRLQPLQKRAGEILATALSSFQQANVALAQGVIDSDDEIDDLQDRIVRSLVETITEQPALAPQAVDLILIAESLERVADHATNIAEDVILVAEARNVKHAGKLAYT